MRFPKLYAIADVGLLRARGVDLREFAEALRAAGVGLVQLRDKAGSPAQVLAAAAVLRSAMPDAMLIMNDRADLADLAVLARFDGVHVGQEDRGVGDARRVLSRTHSSVPHSSQERDEWGTVHPDACPG